MAPSGESTTSQRTPAATAACIVGVALVLCAKRPEKCVSGKAGRLGSNQDLGTYAHVQPGSGWWQGCAARITIIAFALTVHARSHVLRFTGKQRRKQSIACVEIATPGSSRVVTVFPLTIHRDSFSMKKLKSGNVRRFFLHAVWFNDVHLMQGTVVGTKQHKSA